MDTLSNRLKLSILLMILASLTIVCAGTGSGGENTAANYEGPLTASIIETSGTVQVLKAAEGVFKDAAIGQSLEKKDQVLTHEDGRARIDLSTGTIIRLSPLSNFTFETMENSDEGVLTRLRLEIGRLWVILNGGEVEVDTPSGLASVRGSYLHVWVRPDSEETMVTCLEGVCTLGNDEGTVTLVAGQTASITGIGVPPKTGKMSNTDVEEWLEMNPEATKVLLELTATVASYQDPGDKPPTATLIPTFTKIPSITPTAVDCGPPGDWVLYTVKSGDTLKSLAAAFGITVEELKYANCRGDSTVIIVGENLFVPNVPTITPTPTKTPVPTSTPKPTAAATAVPTNSPSVFGAPAGPSGTLPDPSTNIGACTNTYSINVTDADVVKEVKMIYTLDGSIPDWTTAVGQGKYKLLSHVGGGTYEANYEIKSTGAVGDLVKYRFAVKDGSGVISYYPEAGALTFTDPYDCGAPTNFLEVSAPTTPIDSPATCARTYEVKVTDPNGINDVRLWYKVKDGITVFETDITLGNISGDNYGTTMTIDTTGFVTPVTILYEFKAKDGHGNTSGMPGTFSFTDNVGCVLP